MIFPQVKVSALSYCQEDFVYAHFYVFSEYCLDYSKKYLNDSLIR